MSQNEKHNHRQDAVEQDAPDRRGWTLKKRHAKNSIQSYFSCVQFIISVKKKKVFAGSSIVFRCKDVLYYPCYEKMRSVSPCPHSMGSAAASRFHILFDWVCSLDFFAWTAILLPDSLDVWD